ncbi:MAG: NUDIX domain-containing protein [Caldilineaceae bacterium]
MLPIRVAFDGHSYPFTLLSMAKLIFGERISKTGKLATGCAGILFDEKSERILLTRRTDNGRWCLPGGRMEVGEGIAEACEREFWEETGLRVQTVRLIGVYSDPHLVVEYADGNRWQYVSLFLR